MTEEQYALLRQAQQIGLTMDDLRIYLDTHPGDDFAVQRFDMAAQEYHSAVAAWREKYGPLLSVSWQNDAATGWNWGETDFPWDH